GWTGGYAAPRGRERRARAWRQCRQWQAHTSQPGPAARRAQSSGAVSCCSWSLSANRRGRLNPRLDGEAEVLAVCGACGRSKEMHIAQMTRSLQRCNQRWGIGAQSDDTQRRALERELGEISRVGQRARQRFEQDKGRRGDLLEAPGALGRSQGSEG